MKVFVEGEVVEGDVVESFVMVECCCVGVVEDVFV